MKFNPKSLKQLFSAIRKSPIDDMAVNAVKNNADDLALGALDVVDDIPKSISLDDIAVDSWRKKQGLDDFSKSPITPSEFVNDYKSKWHDNFETRELLNTFPEQYANAPTELDLALHADDGMLTPMSNDEIYNSVNVPYTDWDFLGDYPDSYNATNDLHDFNMALYDAGYKFDSTPDYAATKITPKAFGQQKHLINSMDYPDGFTNPDDFARYYDALERGYLTRSDIPHHFYNPSLLADLFTKDRNAMIAGNLLSAQDAFHLPISDATLEQSQMIAEKYLHPDNAFSYRPLSKNRMSKLYNKLLNS